MAWAETRLRGLALVLACLPTLATWGQTYRWVDERGRVHYSDTPPARAAEQAILDRHGRVLRKVDPQAIERPQTTRPDPLLQARERQDRALLSTYVHEGEIDLARERALAQELAKQSSITALLEQTQARKARLNAEAAAQRKAGRDLTASLKQSLDETERELARLKALRARSEKAMEEIHVRYEGYKRRFRELKGMPSGAVSTGLPSAEGKTGQP